MNAFVLSFDSYSRLWNKAVFFSFIAYCLITVNGCGDNRDAAKKRYLLTKESDKLAQCKNYIGKDNFYDKYNLCDIFIKKDQQCRFFTEDKEGCNEFLTKAYYSKTKYSCLVLTNEIKQCKTIVAKHVWYSFFVQYKDLSFVSKIFNYFDFNIDKALIQTIRDIENPVYFSTVSYGYVGKEFNQGVELAVKTINENHGVFGRKIELTKYREAEGVEQSKEIAHIIVNNLPVSAVISLQGSGVTKHAAQTYERGGIVHFIAAATMNKIIRANMQFNFRLVPRNSKIAHKTAEFCKLKGYKKMAILTERNDYAAELSRSFQYAAEELDIEINYRKNFFSFKEDFFSFKEDFLDVIREINTRDNSWGIDAIYLSSGYEPSAKFILQAKAMGLDIPIIGTDALDDKQFIYLVGIEGDGVIIPSIYNEKVKHSEYEEFLLLYKQAYGINPSTWASQGYDAVNILASTMNSLESTVPSEVASGLRFGTEWVGASGAFKFSQSGELVDKEVHFKELQAGEYRFIE